MSHMVMTLWLLAATGEPAALPASAPVADPVLASAKDVYAAVEALTGVKPAGQRKALLGLLAALCSLGLAVAKKWLPALLHKQILALVCIVLGMIIFVCSRMIGDLPFWQSFELALAGPGAMLYHVLQTLPRPSEWVKSERKVREKVAVQKLQRAIKQRPTPMGGPREF